jgi:hypothetical protein
VFAISQNGCSSVSDACMFAGIFGSHMSAHEPPKTQDGIGVGPRLEQSRTPAFVSAVALCETVCDEEP